MVCRTHTAHRSDRAKQRKIKLGSDRSGVTILTVWAWFGLVCRPSCEPCPLPAAIGPQRLIGPRLWRRRAMCPIPARSAVSKACKPLGPSAVAVPWPVRGADHEDVFPDLKFDYCDFSVPHSAPCSILPCLLLSVGHTFRRTRLQIFITQQKARNAPKGCARIEMVVEWKVRFYDVRGTSAFIVLLRWTLERWHVGQIETSQLHY